MNGRLSLGADLNWQKHWQEFKQINETYFLFVTLIE